jgi:hypothetical protein
MIYVVFLISFSIFSDLLYIRVHMDLCLPNPCQLLVILRKRPNCKGKRRLFSWHQAYTTGLTDHHWRTQKKVGGWAHLNFFARNSNNIEQIKNMIKKPHICFIFNFRGNKNQLEWMCKSMDIIRRWRRFHDQCFQPPNITLHVASPIISMSTNLSGRQMMIF